MTIQSILALLTMAMSLLVQVQANPNLPVSFRELAVSTANRAISYAQDALKIADQAPVAVAPSPAPVPPPETVPPTIVYVPVPTPAPAPSPSSTPSTVPPSTPNPIQQTITNGTSINEDGTIEYWFETKPTLGDTRLICSDAEIANFQGYDRLNLREKNMGNGIIRSGFKSGAFHESVTCAFYNTVFPKGDSDETKSDSVTITLNN